MKTLSMCMRGRTILIAALAIAAAIFTNGCQRRQTTASPAGNTDTSQESSKGEIAENADGFKPPVAAAERLALEGDIHPMPVGDVWQQFIALPNEVARFSIVIRRTATPSSGNDQIQVLLQDGGVILTPINESDVTLDTQMGEGEEIVTPAYDRVSSDQIKIAFVGAKKDASPFEAIAALVWLRDDGITPEGAYEDLEAIEQADDALQDLGRNVAYLQISNGSCTGFAITSDLLVTNHHCIASLLRRKLSPCKSIFITFQYYGSGSSRPPIPAQCEGLGPYDHDLDYAMIRFRVNDARIKIGGIAPGNYKAALSGTLQVIHHPYFLRAQWSSCPAPPTEIDLSTPDAEFLAQHRRACGTSAVQFIEASSADVRSAFSYRCDTYDGSSGAPVIFDGKVIGLHYSADYRYFNKVTNAWPENETCLRAHLKLENWARSICDVLAHARSQGFNDVPTCPE